MWWVRWVRWVRWVWWSKCGECSRHSKCKRSKCSECNTEWCLVEIIRVDMRHAERAAGARNVHPQRGVGLVGR